jgi:hypothetical protein
MLKEVKEKTERAANTVSLQKTAILYKYYNIIFLGAGDQLLAGFFFAWSGGVEFYPHKKCGSGVQEDLYLYLYAYLL